MHFGLAQIQEISFQDFVEFGDLVDRLLVAQCHQGDFALEQGGERTSLLHALLMSYFASATCPLLPGSLITD
jgi:hypothetical protein